MHQLLRATKKVLLIQKRVVSEKVHPNVLQRSLSTYPSWPSQVSMIHSTQFNNELIHKHCIHKQQQMQNINGQIRMFGKRGRKGAAMGHHLEKLDELAHRVNKAEKKKKNKQAKKTSTKPTPTALNEQDNSIEENFFFDDDDDDEEEEGGGGETLPSLPSVEKTRKKMEATLSSLEKSFRSIRGAEPTPELFESIPVSAYGSTVPLNTLAQVIISTPSLAVLTCYDPSTTTNVRDAVRDSGMNFNPRVEDPTLGEVQVPIPKVSMETRLAMVKQLHKITERHRLRVRNVRKKANDKVKKGKDGKLDGISKDEAFRVGKEIDDLTQTISEKLNDMLQQKENSIMNV